MRLHKFLFLLTTVSLSLVCEKAASAQDRAYIIQAPISLVFNNVFFLPLLISGNGQVVIGRERSGLGLWTKSKGLSGFITYPENYGLIPKAINYEGDAVVGEFARGQVTLTDSGLFLWTKHAGLEFLKPHFLPLTDGSVVPPINISDDGRRFSFFCNDLRATNTACGSGPLSEFLPWVQQIWSENQNVEDLASKLNHRFNYVQVSGDFKSYLVGVLNTTNFGRLDENGTYFPLENFPISFDPSVDRLIVNRNATLIAENIADNPWPFVWNKEGRLMSIRVIPGCVGLTITNIDDTGAIFGYSFCPKLGIQGDEKVGLRITLQGAQTIGDWLESAGVPNNLGPNATVKLVSDNGKTIYGATNIRPVVGVEGAQSLVEKNMKSDDASGARYVDGPSVFIAHVP